MIKVNRSFEDIIFEYVLFSFDNTSPDDDVKIKKTQQDSCRYHPY